MMQATTLTAVLDAGSSDAPALLAPDRRVLTYADLRAHVYRTAAALRSRGVGRSDRVAIVLSNGPAAASAFLGVAAAACAAPLNPAYREPEYEFYLSDLRARMLLVERGSAADARRAAQRLGIDVVEIDTLSPQVAGGFSISSDADPAGDRPAVEPARPDDQALVLHTSGTTSRPKLVPLTHGNLCASAAHITASLRLDASDRCLNVMPLFHIHGLVAALLASLSAGGSVFCTPGFDALRFFGWLRESEPTWFTAVPTMHRALLARAGRNRSAIDDARLRFVRSSSAALPPPLMEELEATFGVPAIEAYGMTEASHQITVNPLPPGIRKPGSAGLPAGLEVTVIDEAGNVVRTGQPGEVAIRGPNVTEGYENNPEANAECFANGWFRTGDEGYLDEDGYLTLTGRLKEIINRGGEKVSPREVDEVLLDHPAVREAVTFALPDPMLGEAVAAVVILEDGSTASERELRDFTAARLAAFKVPRSILVAETIPTGPTGKLQRIGMAARLGLTD